VTPQGITNISVQSSVSLQHLPVDKAIEKGLPKELLSRLSFATQKLGEVRDGLKCHDTSSGAPSESGEELVPTNASHSIPALGPSGNCAFLPQSAKILDSGSSSPTRSGDEDKCSSSLHLLLLKPCTKR
jgi:hypothetical protein